MTTEQAPRWTADDLHRVGDVENGARIVDSVVGPTAAQTTLLLIPHD